ncbi:MAG: tail fiber protein [Xanthobacteraceae bacterium]|nr:tail fiber protein [Xanthobacteraceae bacterium]
MSDQFVAEIRIFTANFAPVGWAQTNGQLLPINQNTALFSLLGTSFGGNGTSNFALPNLQSCMPMHMGQGAGLTNRVIGEQGGAETFSFGAVAIPSAPPAPTVSAAVGFRQQFQTVSPFQVLNFIIALQGIFPPRS